MDELDELLDDCLRVDEGSLSPPRLWVSHEWVEEVRKHVFVTAWEGRLVTYMASTIVQGRKGLDAILARLGVPESVRENVWVHDGSCIIGIV